MQSYNSPVEHRFFYIPQMFQYRTVTTSISQCSTLIKKTARPKDGLLSDVVWPFKKLSARTFTVMGYLSLKRLLPTQNKRDTKSNKMSLLVRRRAFQRYMTCLCWVTLLPESYLSCRAGWIQLLSPHTNFCPPRAEGRSLFRTLISKSRPCLLGFCDTILSGSHSYIPNVFVFCYRYYF